MKWPNRGPKWKIQACVDAFEDRVTPKMSARPSRLLLRKRECCSMQVDLLPSRAGALQSRGKLIMRFTDPAGFTPALSVRS